MSASLPRDPFQKSEVIAMHTKEPGDPLLLKLMRSSLALAIFSSKRHLQAYTQEYALYVAGLIHQDSRSVIKVVRYGLNIACFPDEHTAELVERQIARQRERR